MRNDSAVSPFAYNDGYRPIYVVSSYVDTFLIPDKKKKTSKEPDGIRTFTICVFYAIAPGMNM